MRRLLWRLATWTAPPCGWLIYRPPVGLLAEALDRPEAGAADADEETRPRWAWSPGEAGARWVPLAGVELVGGWGRWRLLRLRAWGRRRWWGPSAHAVPRWVLVRQELAPRAWPTLLIALQLEHGG